MSKKTKKTHLKPIVSVIIPAYNRPILLKRAIKSVLSQTFKNLELIIVDDGSTDKEVRKIIETFQKKDKRVISIFQKNSGGPANPRNVGIKRARGKYIAFIDGDDEWLPNKIKLQLKLFKSNPALGFVSCNAIIIDENNNTKRYSNIPNPKKIFEHLLSWSCVNSCSGIVIKKKVFDEIEVFDETLKMADDWDLCIRIAEKYTFDFRKEFLFKYYIGQNNVNQKWDTERKEKETDRIFKKHEQNYINHPKAYASKLMHQGKRWAMSGNTTKGIMCFIKSIKLNPFNCQVYLLLFLSFFGTRVLNFIAQIRRKIFKHQL